MKTSKMFTSVALSMLAVSTLLLTTTSCSNEDNIGELSVSAQGYAIPVTVNVSRAGDDGITRATYAAESKTLAFSSGDKLFIGGKHDTAGKFAGTLTWTSGGTFTGVIYTENSYTGTADDMLSSTSIKYANLLPSGYEEVGFLSVDNKGTEALYDDEVSLSTDMHNKAFVAGDKARGVEQLSYEKATGYTSGTGFTLQPLFAVVACTIDGLDANTSYTFTVGNEAYYPTGSVTTDASGLATFCVGFYNSSETRFYTIKIGESSTYKDIEIGSKKLEAGYIYQINRMAIETSAVNLSKVTAKTTYPDGTVLTGTLANDVEISIAAGATVTLKDATIAATKAITCEGSATIIVKGTNSVTSTGEYNAGIQAGGEGTTLTISGPGSLTARGGVSGAGIGSSKGSTCGNITINGGTVTAYGGIEAAAIGGGNSSTCGNITISGGTVAANGGSDAAGIGSGNFGTCGVISIEGGDVTANGGNYGAGIGSGTGSTCSNIIISDGTVVATASVGSTSNDAAGIGTGAYYSERTCTCGNITISGGTVTATGVGGGAGIGSSYDTQCVDITISGGTVTATGSEHAAGIGTGYAGTCNNITITGDVTQLTAIGCGEGHVIGKGDSDNSKKSSCGTVTIDGKTDWTAGTGTDHFTWAVSTTKNANDTWTLTKK
ncbi:MAG: hypothetical protein K5683_10840 [Prevotella sp.]|nr:hypothetical protein [Prevotella sp.]